MYRILVVDQTVLLAMTSNVGRLYTCNNKWDQESNRPYRERSVETWQNFN